MTEAVRYLWEGLRARFTGSLRLRVDVAYDRDAGVWHVCRTDVPGLWMEADSSAELLQRLSDAMPEMIELNRSAILRRFGIRQKRRHLPEMHSTVGTHLAHC